MVVQQAEENEAMAKNLDFERAYAEYRLNKPKEALKRLEKAAASTKDPRCKELRAQVLYKLERFEECFQLYRDIIKNTTSDDDFETERLTNLAAASVYLVNDGKDNPVLVEDEEETYEIIYNNACHLLAQGKWAEAEKALSKAEEMCKNFLLQDMEDDEEAANEEIEKETGIIRVQLGFAIQMQSGREREAQVIYNSVLRNKPQDVGLVAVASNNLLTLNKDQNIFDSKKRIKAATAEGLEHKLTSTNRMVIARNNALLAMYTNQVNLCMNLVKELAEKFDIDQEEQDLIVAGVLSRSGKAAEAVQILLKDGSENLEKVLIATQIYIEKGEAGKAVEIMEKLPNNDKYLPGILSAMVTLYLANDNRQGAAKLLKEAVTWNKKNHKEGGNMPNVWRKTAEFHLKGNEPNIAAQSLEELLKTNPKDRQTLAQLVLAYAKFDLKKALETSKKLPTFNQGLVNIDTLENNAFLSAKHAKRAPKTPASAAKEGGDPSKQEGEPDLLKKKRKKKRKKRLPKNYNPDVDPDPERWLPRRERTGYRKTRKERRKGEKFTGAQGTAAGQSENYDYSQKKGTGAVPKGTKSPPVQEAPIGPRQQQRKPQQKKKGKNKNRF